MLIGIKLKIIYIICLGGLVLLVVVAVCGQSGGNRIGAIHEAVPGRVDQPNVPYVKQVLSDFKSVITINYYMKLDIQCTEYTSNQFTTRSPIRVYTHFGNSRVLL